MIFQNLDDERVQVFDEKVIQTTLSCFAYSSDFFHYLLNSNSSINIKQYSTNCFFLITLIRKTPPTDTGILASGILLRKFSILFDKSCLFPVGGLYTTATPKRTFLYFSYAVTDSSSSLAIVFATTKSCPN